MFAFHMVPFPKQIALNVEVGDTVSEVTSTWNGPVLAKRHAGAEDGGASTAAASGTESLAAPEKAGTPAQRRTGLDTGLDTLGRQNVIPPTTIVWIPQWPRWTHPQLPSS